MVELPLSRFVRIEADFEGPQKIKRGTGFRVSSTRVLTSLHVVRRARSIHVLDPVGAGWKRSSAMLKWPRAVCGSSLDGVLLATDPVDKTAPWLRFAETALTARSRWDSAGYPVLDQEVVRRGLFGTAFESGPAEAIFELTVDAGFPEDVRDWRGISGAPVLVTTPLHGLTVCGVIRNGTRQFAGRRLRAVALPALLAADGFREALVDQQAADSCRWYIDRVAELLSRDQEAARAIAEQVAWIPPAQAEQDESQRARWLAEALGRGSLEQVSAGLCSVYCSLVDSAKLGTAATVFEVMHLALPSAYLARSPGLPARSSSRVSLNVVTEVMAEIVLAAGAGRELRFRAPVNPGRSDLPEPELLVPAPKELGIDPLGDLGVAEVASDLEKRLALRPTTRAGGDRRAFQYIARLAENRPMLFPRSYLGVLDRHQDDDPQKRLQAVIKIVNQRLAAAAAENCRLFFITDPTSQRDRDFLKTLRAALSELLLVTLAGDLGQLAQEDKTCRALQQVFSQRGSGEEDEV